MQGNDIQPCVAVVGIIRILFCGWLREKRPIDSGLRDRDPVKPCKRCVCCEERYLRANPSGVVICQGFPIM